MTRTFGRRKHCRQKGRAGAERQKGNLVQVEVEGMGRDSIVQGLVGNGMDSVSQSTIFEDGVWDSAFITNIPVVLIYINENLRVLACEKFLVTVIRNSNMVANPLMLGATAKEYL